ncbi:MAG: hypothetical protein KME64_42230 [Scytonematopsis contorta HA4267-MV1]|nr:hypothetical protein [Scytonematopsis contorta HA4267-MV1]
MDNKALGISTKYLEVERILDLKQAFEQAHVKVVATKRWVRRKAADFYDAIGGVFKLYLLPHLMP